jgi:hypothetical protein
MQPSEWSVALRDAQIVAEEVALALVFAPDRPDPAEHAAHPPADGRVKVRGEDRLAEAVGRLRVGLADAKEALGERRVACNPTLREMIEASAGCERRSVRYNKTDAARSRCKELGEGVEPDDAAVDVAAEE